MHPQQSVLSPPGPAAPYKASKWVILATLAFGTLMATLDGSIVNIALPTLKKVLQAPNSVQWVVMAYLTALTGTLLIIGRLSDFIGRKRVYLTGFALFTGASLFCGLAQGINTLIFFRVLQGLGASMLFAVAPAIIAETFEARERGKALGIMGSVVALGSSLGPVTGGFLLARFGWPSIFFVNVPLGILAVWRASLVIPFSPRQKVVSFDTVGALLFLSAIVLILLGLHLGPDAEHGWRSPEVLVLLTFGSLLLAAFIYQEHRVGEPMLNPALFARGPFLSAVSSTFFVFFSIGGHSLVMPFFLQEILNLAPDKAGLIMLGSTVTLSIMSPVGGTLADRFGAKYIATAGLLLSASAFFSFSFLNPAWSNTDVVIRLVVLSIGFGLFQSPNSSTALNSAPAKYRGVASGMVAFMRNSGMVCGVAVAAAISAGVRSNYAYELGGSAPEIPARLAGMQAVYLTTSCILLVAAFISVTRKASPGTVLNRA